MKKIILLILMAVVFCNAVVQANENPNLKYDFAWTFREKLAAVQINNKWGFVDSKGNMIVSPKYERPSSFYDGVAVIKLEGKYGLINKNGREVLPAKYDEINSCKDWRNVVHHGLYAVKLNGKWGVYNKNGKEIIPLQYDQIEINSDGTITVNANGKAGLMNKTGKIIIPLVYDDLSRWGQYDRNDPLKTPTVVKMGGKYGLVDRNNKEITPVKYDGIYSVGSELITIKMGNKIGFIKPNGQEIISPQYDSGYYKYSDGLIAVSIGGKWGYINQEGKTVIPFEYDRADGFKDGLAVVEINEKAGLINKANQIVVPIEYDAIYHQANYFHYAGDNVLIVKKDGKNGVLDIEGQEIIPLEYEHIASLGDGLFKVQLHKKFGVIDKNGKTIIPIKCNVYEDIQYDDNKILRASIYGKTGYFGKDGREIIPRKYDRAYAFVDGLAPVKIRNKWGYIDTKGKIVPWSYGLTAPSDTKFLTYQDPMARFTITYPSTWTATPLNIENGPVKIVAHFRSTTARPAAFAITIKELPSDGLENFLSNFDKVAPQDQADFIQGLEAGIKNNNHPQAKITRVAIKKAPSGIPVIEVQYSIPLDQSSELTCLANSYIIDKQMYVLEGGCENSYFAENVPIFENMVSSFTVNP